ncbi:RNA ligase-domain-containing protein [Powellomyces hirtus]|nr:RNA ligase-domain-containing protein [Powellomyces hirtus]
MANGIPHTASTTQRNAVNVMVDGYNALLVGTGGRSRGKVRRTRYSFVPRAELDSGEEKAPIAVYSYNCQEHLYRAATPAFPTLARGLFVVEKGGEGSNDWKIAVRGYDKFFNVSEVPSTKWENLARDTIGPYEATLKENGCIIFASALEGDLIVTSKHALGHGITPNYWASGEPKPSHSAKGEEWLERHLKSVGKTRFDFARFLKTNNVTAVFELVDDDFEEHILEYSPEARGLYLHGLNENIPEFRTWSSAKLKPVAVKFGLKIVDAIVLNTVEEVRKFSDSCRATGSYKGRAIEGFVVRCRRIADLHNVFFFKIKYDEPYLMFREWREITNKALTQVQTGKQMKYTPRFELTRKYTEWVIRKIEEDPEFFKDYRNNKGVIAARNLFLAECNIPNIGKHIVTESLRTTQEYADGEQSVDTTEEADETVDGEWVLTTTKKQKKKERAREVKRSKHSSPPVIASRHADLGRKKTLVIPVATIGAGKTLLARTIAHLYPQVGHIQNDDIVVKKAAPVFQRKVLAEFESKDIVFADKNNHLSQHRATIASAFKDLYPAGKIVVLDWEIEKARRTMGLDAVVELAVERVNIRGENHQSLTPNRTGDIAAVIRNFVLRRDPVDPISNPSDALIDSVVSLSLLDSKEATLYKVIDALDLPRPTQKEYETAVGKSQSHQENIVKQMKDMSLRRKVRYYGVRINRDVDIVGLLDGLFAGAPPQTREIWDTLVLTERIEAQQKVGWHVTLCFVKDGAVDTTPYKSLLDKYFKTSPSAAASASDDNGRSDPGMPVKLSITEVVWDAQVMAIVVGKMPNGVSSINKIPHITVATASDEIKPYTSNAVLERAFSGANGDVQRLAFPNPVEIQGEVRAFFF